MKTTDYNNFKLTLNLSVEIDSNIKTFMEKLKLLHSLNDRNALLSINALLKSLNNDTDNIVENLCNDDTEKK